MASIPPAGLLAVFIILYPDFLMSQHCTGGKRTSYAKSNALSFRKNWCQYRLESLGLAIETQVGRMRAVGSVISIFSKKLIALEVMQIFDALGQEFVVGLLERSSTGLVALVLRCNEERIGVGSIFDEHDGRRRVRLAQRANQRRSPLADQLGLHVGKAVDDVDGRVQLSQKIGDLGLHHPIAGKSEIKHRSVKPSADHGWMTGARPRSRGAVCNRSSIKNNRLVFSRRPGIGLKQRRAFGQTHLN